MILYYEVNKTDRITHGKRERQADTRLKDLLASGVPPKG